MLPVSDCGKAMRLYRGMQVRRKVGAFWPWNEAHPGNIFIVSGECIRAS